LYFTKIYFFKCRNYLNGSLTIDDEIIDLYGSYNSETYSISLGTDDSRDIRITGIIPDKFNFDIPAVLDTSEETTAGTTTGMVVAVPEEDGVLYDVFVGVQGDWYDAAGLNIDAEEWPVDITMFLNDNSIPEMDVLYRSSEDGDWVRETFQWDTGIIVNAYPPGFVGISGAFNMTIPYSVETSDICFDWEYRTYEAYPVDAEIFDANSKDAIFIIPDRHAEGFWDNPDVPEEVSKLVFISVLQ
ncbi:MAG TPA: hypothetical protein DCO79_07730, partial [Spirochaeta sp.]|nr:hypothetical protein [Spirochaeta sp.]